jgi:hypothetical protein
MTRIGSPRLDELTVEEMNAYQLIVVPAAAYLIPATCERLHRTTATVVFTGCFGQSYNAEYVPLGTSRSIAGRGVRYWLRAPGRLHVTSEHALTRGLQEFLQDSPVNLPEGECFAFSDADPKIVTLMACNEAPVLSIAREGRTLFLHGQFFADLCHDPARKPPANMAGSADASANEIDLWGPYNSSHPQQAFGLALMRRVLDHAGVEYRILDPRPRTCTPFLGDHLEQAGISANIAYNNTPQPQKLTLRLPYAPNGYESRRSGHAFLTQVEVPGYSYVALQPAK